jgi:hypothetical protein
MGDGSGVAAIFDPEFAANAVAVPGLPAKFEFAALPGDFNRSAAFLFAPDVELFLWLLFAVRFAPVDDGALR